MLSRIFALKDVQSWCAERLRSQTRLKANQLAGELLSIPPPFVYGGFQNNGIDVQCNWIPSENGSRDSSFDHFEIFYWFFSL